MSPTVVVDRKHPELMIGAAGGPRIPSMVAQVVMAVADRSLQEAMQLPRVHHQHSPAQLTVEPNLPADAVRLFENYGFNMSPQRAIAIGAAIRWDAENNELSASLDPRFGAWN